MILKKTRGRMSDNEFEPEGRDNQLPPVSLNPKRTEICKILDDLYGDSKTKRNLKPSDMLKGAIFAIRPELMKNKDQIAQAAHSLREIFYPFRKDIKKDPNLKKTKGLYDRLCDIAHHNHKIKLTIADFEDFLSGFEDIMVEEILPDQITANKKIDKTLGSDPPRE